MKVSERFACRVTGQNRTTQRHQAAASTPADPDAALRTWQSAVGRSSLGVANPATWAALASGLRATR
jgi:hypothetical protein